jgi:hypothetical protein
MRMFLNCRRSMASSAFAAAWLFGCLAVSSYASAQTVSSIVGKVLDDTGGTLPGVTVTASSPALQVPQITTVTNDSGEYRLTPLPVGTYAVVYELTGFQTVRREGLRLTLGFEAKVDVTLNVSGIQETVTISGAAPVVDVSNGGSRTQLTLETLELTPTSRSGYLGVFAQAPGVVTQLDVGGSGGGGHTMTRAFGQSAEGWNIVDGVVTTSPQVDGGAANYTDFATFEEASVQTFGTGAEAPTRGPQLVTVVKTGSNVFSGTAYYSGTNDKFQGNNLDDALRAQGVTVSNGVQSRWDASGELGGRILLNKLWFYESVRERKEFLPALGVFNPDGIQAVAYNGQKYETTKVSYQLTSNQQLIGYYSWNHKPQLPTGSITTAQSAAGSIDTWDDEEKVEWQGILRKSLVVSLLVGRWHYNSYLGRSVTGSTQPASSDISPLVTVKTFGQSLTAEQYPVNNRPQATGTVSWYKPKLFLGNHAFKVGATIQDTFHARDYSSRIGGNYQLIFNNRVPFEINMFNFPTSPGSDGHYFGTYATDTWEAGQHLTLNIGVRVAHDHAFVPGSCRSAADAPSNIAFPATCTQTQDFPSWNTIQPRLHATYDLSHDGKTVIKGGWGRFYHIYTLDPDATIADPNLAQSALYRWHDLNGNNNYDPGEVNLSLTGPDYLSTLPQANQTATTGGGTYGVPNGSLQDPRTDEFSAAFEREILPNTSVRITGIYSRVTNVMRNTNLLRPPSAYTIAITKPDPGPDGKVGTADDPGTSLTYYEYPTSLIGPAFQLFTFINDPNADQTFKSFEIAMTRRFSSGWQVAASFSETKKHIPFGGIPGFNSNTVVGDNNPNSQINTTDNTSEWNGKMSGSYFFGGWLGLRTSVNYQMIQGTPAARTVVLTGGAAIPSITVNAEPLGTERLPTINLADVRLERTFSLPGKRKLIGRATLFNTLNTNAATAISFASGVTYGRTSSIMPPRIVELGASLVF